MTKPLTTPKYFLISVILTLVLIFNLLFFQSLILGLIFGLGYLLFFGWILGLIILPEEKRFWQVFYGTLILLSLITSILAIIYYFYRLSDFLIILILIILPPLLFFVSLFKKEKKPKFFSNFSFFQKKEKLNPLILILAIGFLVFEVINFYLLFLARTGEALRSPWWIVSSQFFIFYFFASLILFSIIFYNKKTTLTLILIIIHAILTISVALIVYQIGYGFDPFIHQATEKTIAQQGLITPKPFYYLGQYVLVVFLAKIFAVSIEWLDKLLVPVLAAIILPLVIFYVFQKIFKEQKNFTPVMALIFFLLPFSSLIFTTPQSLANLFTLLVIFLSLIYIVNRQKEWLIISLALVLTILVIHPLAGLPVLIFFLFLWFFSIFGKHQGSLEFLRKVVILEILVLASLLLPLIFVLNSVLSPQLGPVINQVVLSQPVEELIKNIKLASPYFKNHFNLIYDIIYWYGFNLNFILVLGGVLGIILLFLKFKNKLIFVYPLTFVILIINYLILKLFFDFSFLIEYERGEYPQRLIELSFYFLIPFFLYAIYELIKKILLGHKALIFGLILFLSLGLTCSLYLSYPRDDDYHLDRGYNVTQTDINAVRYINEDALGDYIVLANQITSVAAIKEFGFKKYYPAKDGSGKLYFYYPIPTGDPMYQYYLEMVYQYASKETVKKAMDLVGVDVAYFVINKYWWKFEEILEQAKQTADSWYVVDNSKAYVFRYKR